MMKRIRGPSQSELPPLTEQDTLALQKLQMGALSTRAFRACVIDRLLHERLVTITQGRSSHPKDNGRKTALVQITPEGLAKADILGLANSKVEASQKCGVTVPQKG